MRFFHELKLQGSFSGFLYGDMVSGIFGTLIVLLIMFVFVIVFLSWRLRRADIREIGSVYECGADAIFSRASISSQSDFLRMLILFLVLGAEIILFFVAVPFIALYGFWTLFVLTFFVTLMQLSVFFELRTGVVGLRGRKFFKEL
jgi:NADH:ubiquinone oxidoreductase subunit 3 (subunit A)